MVHSKPIGPSIDISPFTFHVSPFTFHLSHFPFHVSRFTFTLHLPACQFFFFVFSLEGGKGFFAVPVYKVASTFAGSPWYTQVRLVTYLLNTLLRSAAVIFFKSSLMVIERRQLLCNTSFEASEAACAPLVSSR